MIRFDGLPAGAQALTPYLVVQNGQQMVEFYKKALGATVVDSHNLPGSDKIMHAHLKVGGSSFFINDEFPDQGALSPKSIGSSGSSMHIGVSEGIDELFKQAIGAGAVSVMDPADMFWGDRLCMFTDPSGHKWSIGMSIPNPPKLSDEELREMLGSK